MSPSITPAEDAVRAMHAAAEAGLQAFVAKAKPQDRRWLAGQVRLSAELRLLAAQEMDAGRDFDELLDRAGELFASMAAGLGSAATADGKRESVGVIALARALDILTSGERPGFHQAGASVAVGEGGRG